jgi:dipeptidase E
LTAPLYLLAGGRSKAHSKSNELLIRMAVQSAGVPSPRVAYVGSASGDNPLFFGMMKQFLAKAGSGRVELARSCSRKADMARFRAAVEAADLVFISGGDVKEGMDVLNEKGAADFLRDCHRDGKPFFGISAGSIMMGSHWIFWEDEDDDGSAALFPCLGFAPLVCDTHDDTGKWDELKAALKLLKTPQTGYGLPSGGGILVNGSGRPAALGCSVKRYAAKNGAVRKEKDLVPGK